MPTVDDIYCDIVHALTSYVAYLWLMLLVYGYCDISGYISAAKFLKEIIYRESSINLTLGTFDV